MRRLPGSCLAALLATAALCGAKPPDLPNDPKITVVAQGATGIPGYVPAFPMLPLPIRPTHDREEGFYFGPSVYIPRALTAHDLPNHAAWQALVAFWLNMHPFVTLDLDQPVKPECGCPRLRCDAPRVVESRLMPSVLDNLHKLEQAAEGMQAARELAEAGRLVEALECLGRVRRLCPGSGYERRADEAIGQLLVGACLEWIDNCRQMPHPSRRVAELLRHTEPVACGKAACSRVDGPSCPSWCPAEVKLVLPVSVSFDRVPLSDALDGLRAAGVAVVVDGGELGQCGYPDLRDLCVTVNADRVPLRAVLDAMLRPFGLEPRPEGQVIRVGVQQGRRGGKGEEACEEPPPANVPVCPKCDEMHLNLSSFARNEARIARIVTRYMKACHVALAAGQHKKAAILAGAAYSFDPILVEGDPIVYKLHLLAAKPAQPECGPACEVVRVGQILVVGNHRTPASVLLRHVPLFPGAVLSYAAVEKAEKNLARLNLFDTPPTVTVLDGKGTGYKDILITVKEVKTGSLMIGLGVNTDAGLTGSIVLNERNFDVDASPTSFVSHVEGTALGDLCATAWRLLCPPPAGRGKDRLEVGVSPFGSLTLDGQVSCWGTTFRVSLRDGLPFVWVMPAADAR